MGAVPLLGFDIHAGARLAPAYELLIAGRAMAAAEAAQVQRLQDVGLSLCIWAGKYGHAAAGLDERLLVISEIFEAQRFDVHTLFLKLNS